MAAGTEAASPWRMRTTFAGTRLQALSIIFVRSFSAWVVGRKRIRRPLVTRSKGQCYGSFPKRCAKGFGGTSTRPGSALPLLPASALRMALLDIARQQRPTPQRRTNACRRGSVCLSDMYEVAA